MSNKPEIKFKYVFSYNYNPVYVNGAHGGISPRGELVVNFYLERPPLPNSIAHEINQNGTIGNETAFETARQAARLEGIPCGISSGAAIAAALEIGTRPEMKGKTIVAIIPSFAERYLSTALFDGL